MEAPHGAAQEGDQRLPAEAKSTFTSFITGAEAGIPKIIEFMNDWARELGRLPNLLLIRYEDLKADTTGQLGRALRFLARGRPMPNSRMPPNFASIENMRRMEQENAGKLAANARLKPGDANDPSSFKVRRAKVGGWRDYVTEEQAAAIDRDGARAAEPVYGYTVS